MGRLMTEKRTDGRKDWRTDEQTDRKKERKKDGRTYVELFHPMAIQPSLNTIATESKAPPEKQNYAVRWIAIFSYFPKRTGKEPLVVVLWTHTHTLSLYSHCPQCLQPVGPYYPSVRGFRGGFIVGTIVGTIVPLLYVIIRSFLVPK